MTGVGNSMLDLVGRKVCLIDDDPINNLICEVLLKRSGLVSQLTVFLDGAEALDWLEVQPEATWPDVIYLDINMPGLNGWEVLARLEGFIRPVSVKILTSSVSEMERDYAKHFALVNDYLIKPLKREHLWAL